jgi:hypothetical protein
VGCQLLACSTREKIVRRHARKAVASLYLLSLERVERELLDLGWKRAPIYGTYYSSCIVVVREDDIALSLERERSERIERGAERREEGSLSLVERELREISLRRERESLPIIYYYIIIITSTVLMKYSTLSLKR